MLAESEEGTDVVEDRVDGIEAGEEALFVGGCHFVGGAGEFVFCAHDRVVEGVEVELDDLVPSDLGRLEHLEMTMIEESCSRSWTLETVILTSPTAALTVSGLNLWSARPTCTVCVCPGA